MFHWSLNDWVLTMAKMKVKVKRDIKNVKKEIDKATKHFGGVGVSNVKVGLPKGSNNYPDGTSVIMVGTVQEFGSPARNVPARSFLRSTIVENKNEYNAFMKKAAKKIAKSIEANKGKIKTPSQGVAEVLNLLGLKTQADVRQKMTDISSPILKDREGNPLVDTGHLRQAINYQVEVADDD